MSMQKQKKNPSLPHELIEEILLRLPVKSLLRFKCVCQSWLTLISDPQFAKSHFDLAASPTHRFLMRPDYGNKFKSVDIEASLNNDSGVVNRVVTPPPRSHNPQPYDSIDILGSCRGFILLCYQFDDIIVWNPSIGVHKQIPDSHYALTLRFLYGFGYDPTTEDYLAVLLASREPEIDDDQPTCSEFFSFIADSWCPIEDVAFPYGNLGYERDREGSYLNKALHWLVYSRDTLIYLIIAFDLVEKRLFEIFLPAEFHIDSKYSFHMEVMGGCLSMYWNNGEVIEIWMMKEYKVHSSWTKCFVLSGNDIPHNHNIFRLLGLTKSGGLFGSTYYGGLVKLNDKQKLLDHHHLYDQWSYLESAVYRESLLSLPTLFEEEAIEDDQESLLSFPTLFEEEASEDDQQ